MDALEVSLRRLKETDRDDLIMLESDPDNTALTGLTKGPDEFFRFCMDGAVSYAVMLGELFAGHVTFFKSSLTSLPGKPEAYEVCFGIFPECRGMGMGRRALAMGLKKAETELGAEVILAGAFSFNGPSLALLESEGFRYIFSRKDTGPEGEEREERIFMKLL